MKILILIILSALLISSCSNEYPEVYDLSNEKFELIDQDSSKVVFPDFVKGKTVVMNFIFTNCPDICPLSTNNMRLVQEELKKQKIENVEFVSLSFDPEVDKPSVLKKFGEIRNLDFSNWTFLTGNKESIKRILKLTNIVAAPSDSSELNGQMIYYYIHTDRISVMDKDGIIRKDHLGSSVNIDELINDIKEIGD